MLTPVALLLVGAVLAQGALALMIVFCLGSIRIPMVTRGEVGIRDIATSRDGWPARERPVSNALDNQFQLPVLFYVAALLSLQFGVLPHEVLLAWTFV